MQNEFLLSLIVPLEIKDDLVDTLMEQEDITGFTLFPVDGFSKKHSEFNIKEQVEGYRRYYKFEIMHSIDIQQALLQSIKPICEASNIRYWVYDLNSSGNF